MISIILPAYNAERFIARAIDSIIKQTFPEWELILVDDGSTDKTVEIAKSFKDNRIWVFMLGQNKGIVEALNYGLDLAFGEFIARHDADDTSHPYRLERQLKYLNEHPDVDIVGTAMVIEEGNGRMLSTKKYPKKPTHGEWMEFCQLAHPTVMMHRKVYDVIGGYDPDFDMACCEDYDYWLRAKEKFVIHNIPEALYFKTEHPDSNIGSNKRSVIKAFDELARLKARIRYLKTKT